DGRDDLRTKGSALALRVVVRRDGKRFELPLGRGVAAGSGARGAELPRLRAGDALRFVVTVGRRGYLAVFSVDGRRQVTSFYPQTSDDPALSKKPLRLARAGKHVLPGSVVLDDAPGREHVVVVFGLRAFDRAALARRAARLILSGQALTAQALGVDAIARLSFDRDREGPTE
ncbi:MAG: DUF4384 domain-containing protein, partial [Myxococcales bacterium]|nr:DUF4384 domain-containing protein [Myxococcales bacterium]